MVKIKDFSRPLSVFQVLFKTNLIFKDFSRQSCIFKYFSSLCKPCKNTCMMCPLISKLGIIFTDITAVTLYYYMGKLISIFQEYSVELL